MILTSNLKSDVEEKEIGEKLIKIKEATKKGYANQDTEIVLKIGNYSPSGHNAVSIVDIKGIAPTVMENHGTITAIVEEQKEVFVYDDYNSNIRKDQNTIGTITTNIGNNAFRSGYKLIEVEDKRFYNQALETFKKNECKEGDIINAYNQTVEKSGVAPTLTTRPEGFKTAILPITKELRIRKLTPKECWRLMGVKDSDFKNVAKNQSQSSLYHLAGDSIVTTPLMAMFGELLGIDYEMKIRELVEELKENNKGDV